MPADFPQFDVPASVPGASTTAQDAPSSPAPAAAAPPEPKVEVAPVSDPLWAPLSAQREAEAAAAATTEPAATPAPTTPEPQGTAIERAVLAQGEVLARLADRLTQPPPQQTAPAAPVARGPKSVAIEQALIKHVPQLAPLIAALNDPTKAKALEQILEAAPQHQQQVSQFYADFAEQTVSKLASGYVTAYGLDPKAVTPELESDLSEQFQLWVARPGNERMLQRYEMGDIRVVDAFNEHFVQRFVAPAKRQGQAAVAARGAAVAALPRGGGSSIPTPQQTAPRVASGEQDVFAEAWTELAGKRAAG